MRSTIERRFGDWLSVGRRSSSSVARTAPHREWPRTTMSRVPNRSAANSTLPIWEGATMFPATRMTNRSPRPWSKTISAGTRESEHPRMMANGSWPAANSMRRAWLVSVSRLRTPDTKRRFPSRRRSSASRAEMIDTIALVRLTRLHRLVRSETENRKCRGDLLEFRKRGIFVHGHVRSRSRSALQVSPQDGWALVGGNLFELDVLTAAAAENRSSTGCPHIADPLHVVSEHRHQVPLSIDDGHDQRERDGPPRLSSGHFQCHKVVGRDARRGHSSPRSIQNPGDPVGSLPTVQPPM